MKLENTVVDLADAILEDKTRISPDSRFTGVIRDYDKLISIMWCGGDNPKPNKMQQRYAMRLIVAATPFLITASSEASADPFPSEWL
jgi:hypothetical protein